MFKLTNNRSPVESYAGIRNKLPYEHLETQRFIRKHRITDFQFNPFFPVNTLALMRGAIAAQRLDVFAHYVDRYSATCGRNREKWTTRKCSAPRSRNPASMPTS